MPLHPADRRPSPPARPGILFRPARPSPLLLGACGAKKNASSPRRPPPLPIDHPWRPVAQGLVQSLLVVVPEVPPQPARQLWHRLVAVQVHVLVLGCPSVRPPSSRCFRRRSSARP